MSPAMHDEHNRTTSDTLLFTLLSQEDQHHYSQINNIQLPHHILHILHQLTSLLHSSSTLWMSITLLKKLILQQHSIDLIIVIASFTLAHKYQQSHIIDYQLIAQSSHIDDIQLIHDAEVAILDALSYDISVSTPDDFFSYLSNLANNDEEGKDIIEQARCSLSSTSLSHQTFDLLHNYPSSIVVLSLISHHFTSNSFINEQIKSFVLHKKDASNYLKQLIHCTTQLQSHMAQS
ncbi:hypothetical protein I4U23_023909 [Adineta vaga]|nr:hypothetical protein I4U23_023909 [Adineta vaga]